MDPVALLITSLWKFLTVVGVLGVATTTIAVLTKKGIKSKVGKSRAKAVAHAVDFKNKEKSKSKKLAKNSERIINRVDEKSKPASAVEVRVKNSGPQLVNTENFSKEGKKASSTLATPGLKKLADDYLAKIDLKAEKQFSTVKIIYPNTSRNKNEELTAPTNFVECLFVPKVVYECAIAENISYPVTISIGAGKNEKGQEVADVITLDSKNEARDLAISYISQMDPRLVEKAEMSLEGLAEPVQDQGTEK